MALPETDVETVPAAQVELPRVLTLWDVVLFNIVAILSLRWTATAAAAGPSSLTMWVLAALLFFVPQGLAVGCLPARFPNEGGIYFWTKRSFGESHGFLCGWTYLVNNILYYPNLLMSTAAIGTYVIGRGDTGLMDNWTYIFVATLTWSLARGVAQRGGTQDRQVAAESGRLGHLHPGCGAGGVRHSRHAHPRLGHTDQLDNGKAALRRHVADQPVGLDCICLCRTGALRRDGRRGQRPPRRTLPRSIYISAPFIAFLYIAGTASLLWLLPSGEVHIVSGFFQAMATGARDLGGLGWLIQFTATFYVLGNIGGVGAWLTGPARVAFVIGLDRYFPPALGRVHPRWKTPYVAILTQAVLATVFLGLSVLGKGTTVERAYLVLLDTMLLIYFIPLSVPICLLPEHEPQRAADRGTPVARTTFRHAGDRDGRLPAHGRAPWSWPRSRPRTRQSRGCFGSR